MHTTEKYELLLSTISHEIRNPVTLINSYLQLILAAHPEVGTYEYWDTVGEEMQHLKKLLGELSLFNNSMRIQPIALDMNKWMHAFCLHGEAFLHSLGQDLGADINFTTLIASDLPTIQADPDKLQQVLDNLLRNAAEAVSSSVNTTLPQSDSRDVRPASGHITLEVTADESVLFLAVSDNGCGISPEQLPHLFEPFVSYKNEGTGLGLAIVDRIIKAHHGTITVHSEPSSGTRFIISLPCPPQI